MQSGLTVDTRKSMILTIALLVIAGSLGRLIPHAPNATPMTAIGLVAGAALGGRFALVLPLSIMAVTDLLIGTYEPRVMIAVYVCFLFPVLLGYLGLRGNRNPFRVALSATISSAIFFVVTNFAVWYGSGWYPQNSDGLWECYLAALPFFRNMLAADLVWSAALFTGLAFVESRQQSEVVLSGENI